MSVIKNLKSGAAVAVTMISMGSMTNAFAQSSLPAPQHPNTIKGLVTQVTKPGIGRYGELTQAGASVVYKCGLIKVFQDTLNNGIDQKTLFSSAGLVDDRNLKIFPLGTLGSDYSRENIIDAQDVLASSNTSMKHFINGGVTPGTVDVFELRINDQCRQPGGGSSAAPVIIVPGTPGTPTPPPPPPPAPPPTGSCDPSPC